MLFYADHFGVIYFGSTQQQYTFNFLQFSNTTLDGCYRWSSCDGCDSFNLWRLSYPEMCWFHLIRRGMPSPSAVPSVRAKFPNSGYTACVHDVAVGNFDMCAARCTAFDIPTWTMNLEATRNGAKTHEPKKQVWEPSPWPIGKPFNLSIGIEISDPQSVILWG